jgi:hypothetical protein
MTERGKQDYELKNSVEPRTMLADCTPNVGLFYLICVRYKYNATDVKGKKMLRITDPSLLSASLRPFCSG